ncbi:hypothetical protein D9613_012234 [Agrocybe pediades]|uniref:Endosomal/vacuolar adapter protein YPT35 n=1 Tax=Agrocybe pediades TaxID=84607 RepID=A0A8H4VIY4_9AGAR|nr:hypothetical protein D9613_012234 [Agrocybe pediades]
MPSNDTHPSPSSSISSSSSAASFGTAAAFASPTPSLHSPPTSPRDALGPKPTRSPTPSRKQERHKFPSPSPPVASPVELQVHPSVVQTQHPFAHSTAKLELIPNSKSTTKDGIDLEEEARLYEELMSAASEGMEDEGLTRPKSISRTPNKLIKPKHSLPSLPSLPIFGERSTNERTRTTSSYGSGSTPRTAQPIASTSNASSTNTFPYAARVKKTHRRRTSSLPPVPFSDVQSVFSADIFLRDKTTAGGGAGTDDGSRNDDGEDHLFARDVRIDGWSTVGDGGGRLREKKKRSNTMDGQLSSAGMLEKVVQGGGAYVVYDIVIKTREGTEMRVLKRYSAFEELRENLIKRLDPSLHALVPALPPKSALAKFRPAFLEQRRKMLQFFLVGVLLRPELGGREEVRAWVLE